MKYIVFIDIVGSTAALKNDPEGTKKFMNIYKDLVRGSIDRLTGEIVNSMGDGFYIQFDSTHDAVKVITGLAALIEAISEFKNALAIRVGVNFGNIDRETDVDININIAQRLESVAKSNHINISEKVHDFIKNKGIKYAISECIKNIKELDDIKYYSIKILDNDNYKKCEKTRTENKPTNAVGGSTINNNTSNILQNTNQIKGDHNIIGNDNIVGNNIFVKEKSKNKNDTKIIAENREIALYFYETLNALSNKINKKIIKEDDRKKRNEMMWNICSELNDIKDEIYDRSHRLGNDLSIHLLNAYVGLTEDLGRVEIKKGAKNRYGVVDSIDSQKLLLVIRKWIMDNFEIDLTLKDLE